MKVKKFLTILSAISMIISIFGVIPAFADADMYAVYASADGSGDGLSEENPMAFDDALNAVKNGGTVYIKGTVGSAETGHYQLGRTDKAINFVGIGDDAAITSLNTYNLAGKISFSNLKFTPVNEYDPFGFKAERGAGVDVTFGENITTPTFAKNKNVAFLTANTENKMTFDSGTFGTVFAGGYNGNLSGVNTDITVNGGSVNIIAVANGWSSGGWNASLTWSGNYSFTVNGGKVNNITMGHLTGGLRTTRGIVKTVVNGGDVGTICLTAANKDINSSGLRIAEINGGSVNTVKVGETPVNKGFKTIVILNNGMAENISAMNDASFDTVIKADAGAEVSAVYQDSALKGYKIISDKIVDIDGKMASPDGTSGLYSIGGGVHTVTVQGELMESVYASADGSGDGLSEESPMAFDDALNAVKNGGTVYIKGTVGSAETGHYALGRIDKAINFVGIGDDAAIASLNTYNLAGKISFSNLRFAPVSNYDFGFKAERGVGTDVTFGDGITTPSNASNKNVAFLTANSENKMTVNSGDFGTVFAGGYNGSLSGVSTDITVNGGSVNIIAVANGWRNTANTPNPLIWKGNYSFTVNGGAVNKITMGHLNGLPNTTQGTVKTVINDGTVGTICLTADVRDIGSSGLRIAEINGGTVNAVKIASDTPINKNYKTIVILNNGMTSTMTDASFDTVIKADTGIRVSAVCGESGLTGYEISADCEVISVDGEPVFPDSATGLYSIGGGIHRVTAAKESWADSTVRTTWVKRAEALLATENAVFTNGAEQLNRALITLKYSESADDETLVSALRNVWNTVEYTIGDNHYIEKLYDFGDCNGDRKCDILDLVRAKKSISSPEYSVEKFTLDINSDGMDDTNDLVLLRKILLNDAV